MSIRSVVIVGGGLAGLTCAKSLIDAGMRVLVLESLPFLGGRASTYRDEDGEWIEQGLHLFLGVYSEFRKLLAEIGRPSDEVLIWQNQMHMQDPSGPQATYGINPLFAPFSTILSVLGQNDYLGIADKLTVAPLAAPAVQTLKSIQEKYDGMTVLEWWRKVSGREEVLERFLRPLCRAIQFTDADQFSAYDFLGWIHNSLYDVPHLELAGYRGARDETIFAPLGRYLTDRGAAIKTDVAIRSIEYSGENQRVTAVISDHGERFVADDYVFAIPAWHFTSLIPSALNSDPFFSGIAKLPIAPAISVQLWFDRPITRTSEFYLIARSRAPVYQEQSPHTYPVSDGSRMSVIVSPADDLLEASDAELIDLVLAALRDVNKAAIEAIVRKSVILRHTKHLIRPFPGAMSSRPSQKTPIANLFLAGDWTQQEFFGSQEGAVRSGRYSASAIINNGGVHIKS